jgi:DNA-binding CsgD family transcriptional regulator
MATMSHLSGDPEAMLERARVMFRAGDALGAWALCEDVAEIGRDRSDAAILARAALVVRGVASHALGLRINSLCHEAIARLGSEDRVLAARLRAQLAATTDLWGTMPEEHPAATALAEAEATGDDEAILLALEGQRAARSNPLHAREWLEIGARAIELGLRVGQLDRVAWGRFCRMDAFWMLGDRVALEHEIRVLGAEAHLDREPVASWHLGLVRASLALHDGRFDLAERLADRAIAEGRRLGLGDAAFFDMIFRTHFTAQVGPDPAVDARTERSIREAVDSGVFLGRLYLASFLSDRGRDDEASQEWRLVRRRLDEIPTHLHEFVVGLVNASKISVRQQDLEPARYLYGELLPIADMQVTGAAHTPSLGPASLYLAELAELLGDAQTAEDHARDAVASAVSMASPTFEARALLVLSRIVRRRGRRDSAGRDARGYAASSRAIAERIGWTAFLPELDSVDGGDDRGGLSKREYEIAALIASGRNNRQIADGLFLSERTVETHITHIFTKLGVASRVDVAMWHAGRESPPQYF